MGILLALRNPTTTVIFLNEYLFTVFTEEDMTLHRAGRLQVLVIQLIIIGTSRGCEYVTVADEENIENMTAL